MIVVLANEIMNLHVGAFLSGEQRLMCKVGDEEGALAIFVGEWRRLPEDGENNLSLSVFVYFDYISIFRNTEYFILDYNGGGQFVAVLGNDLAFLQFFDMSFALHYYYKLQK